MICSPFQKQPEPLIQITQSNRNTCYGACERFDQDVFRLFSQLFSGLLP